MTEANNHNYVPSVAHGACGLHNQICTALPQARKNLWAVSGTCAVLFHLCGFSIAEPRKNCGTVTVAY